MPRLSLTGATNGRVKLLSGFHKRVHRVPDAITPATEAFLARVCADDLAAEGEAFFQDARAALAYKRKDIALEVAGPLAILTARDFTFDIAYSLLATDPACYVLRKRLHRIRNPEILAHEAFNQVFAGIFSSLVFGLKRALPVEDVIDAVEGLEEDAGLCVAYPSDCRECTITVQGVAAAVVCDGASLEMRFDRTGSPSDLFNSFESARHAFSMTRNAALAALT